MMLGVFILLCYSSLPFSALAWSWNFPGTTQQQQKKAQQLTYKNNLNHMDYPWYFRGRAVMRPALVKIDDDPNNNNNKQEEEEETPSSVLRPLSLLGWTVGGTVALEYDESPVGPYREYVSLGGLALSQNSGRWIVGQYGSRLSVSEPEADTLCRVVWNLNADTVKILFREQGEKLSIDLDPDSAMNNQTLVVQGWNKVRQQRESGPTLNGLPLLWTPAIKAIWAPVAPTLSSRRDKDELPLHRLRISGSPRLCWNGGNGSSPPRAFSLGIDIVLPNILIEISERIN